MGIFSSIEQLGSRFTEPVNLALGMFDGVHLGHQQVLQASQNHACEINGNAVAFTFPTHPASFLRPEHAPPLLMNAEQKAKMLHSYGMNHVILRSFDHELAQVEADEFALFMKERIPSVAGFSVGKNFRFGKDRIGDASFLKHVAGKMGIEVEIVDFKSMDGTVVSSSIIREKLKAGDITNVNHMLGRSYRIDGIVSSGKKMGRQIGFPTMNIAWNPEATPAFGVYAGMVKHLGEGIKAPAVANYGIRPTVENDARVPKLEIHILDEFNEEKWGYNSEVEMALEHFIRPEKKFDSIDELKKQIEMDRSKANALLQMS